MTRIRNFGWNRLKLATLSYEEISALEDRVKQEHACNDGIHMYDKSGRDKLDALSWAIYNKQKKRSIDMSMTTNKQTLREKAERAKELGNISQYKTAIVVRLEFNEAANPATVLALLDELEAAEKRIAELEKRKPDLYLCRVNRGGEELYSPCGKDYPRGRGYIASGITVKGDSE